MCVSVVTVCLPMGWQQLSQLLHECNKRMFCNQFGVCHFNFEIITDKKSQKTLNYSIFYQYHNQIKWAWHSWKNEKVICLSSMNTKYINNRVKVCKKFFWWEIKRTKYKPPRWDISNHTLLQPYWIMSTLQDLLFPNQKNILPPYALW